MAEFLIQQASQNPSFAGPFWPYMQQPMKTFNGQAALVPLEVAIGALDVTKSGAQSGAAVMPELASCMGACSKTFGECLFQGGSQKLGDIDATKWKSCADKARMCLVSPNCSTY